MIDNEKVKQERLSDGAYKRYLIEIEKLVDLDPEKGSIDGNRLEYLCERVEVYEDVTMLREKREEYVSYLEEHRVNIKIALEIFIRNLKDVPTSENVENIIRVYPELETLVHFHDNSKLNSGNYYLSDDNGLEFDGYRKKFFPVLGEEQDEELFNQARALHIKKNPHHWRHWVIHDPKKPIALPMPYKYVLEMLLDWMAVSIKFGGSAEWYYNKEKESMILHKKTIEIIKDNIELTRKNDDEFVVIKKYIYEEGNEYWVYNDNNSLMKLKELSNEEKGLGLNNEYNENIVELIQHRYGKDLIVIVKRYEDIDNIQKKS